MKVYSKEREEVIDGIIEKLKPKLKELLGQLLDDNGFGFCPKCPHKNPIEILESESDERQ